MQISWFSNLISNPSEGVRNEFRQDRMNIGDWRAFIRRQIVKEEY